MPPGMPPLLSVTAGNRSVPMTSPPQPVRRLLLTLPLELRLRIYDHILHDAESLHYVQRQHLPHKIFLASTAGWPSTHNELKFVNC
jgi:hypothetical protein